MQYYSVVHLTLIRYSCIHSYHIYSNFLFRVSVIAFNNFHLSVSPHLFNHVVVLLSLSVRSYIYPPILAQASTFFASSSSWWTELKQEVSNCSHAELSTLLVYSYLDHVSHRYKRMNAVFLSEPAMPHIPWTSIMHSRSSWHISVIF